MSKSTSPAPRQTKAARIRTLLSRKAGYAIEHTKPAAKDRTTVYRIISTPAARR